MNNINKSQKVLRYLRTLWWAKHRASLLYQISNVFLNTSYFRGQRLINCFWTSTADPLWDRSSIMKPPLFGFKFTASLTSADWGPECTVPPLPAAVIRTAGDSAGIQHYKGKCAGRSANGPPKVWMENVFLNTTSGRHFSQETISDTQKTWLYKLRLVDR